MAPEGKAPDSVIVFDVHNNYNITVNSFASPREYTPQWEVLETRNLVRALFLNYHFC